MIIPPGAVGTPAEGKPCLHTSHIRSYGAGGFKLGEMEQVRGCPAQYRARYVKHEITSKLSNDSMLKGSVLHDALFRMEEHSIGPEEALKLAWIPELPMTAFGSCVDDLNKYLERSGQYSTLQVEVELYAPLYEDEEFGEIWFGGRIDKFDVDPEEENLLHVIDYKSNNWPPTLEDVKGDIQLKGYSWLVSQNWQQFMSQKPRIIAHLDAIKFRDVEWEFEDSDLEEWREWASSIASKILRDEEAEPILNPGCTWCPIKLDCKKFRQLPGRGTTMLEKKNVSDINKLLAWLDEAKDTVKKLKSGIDDVEEILKDKIVSDGEVIANKLRYYMENGNKTETNLRKLHDILGDKFYSVAKVNKADTLTLGKNLGKKEAVEQCFETVTGAPKMKTEPIEVP